MAALWGDAPFCTPAHRHGGASEGEPRLVTTWTAAAATRRGHDWQCAVIGCTLVIAGRPPGAAKCVAGNLCTFSFQLNLSLQLTAVKWKIDARTVAQWKISW